jgi:predicted NBD/HSP70 family sugar kinase
MSVIAKSKCGLSYHVKRAQIIDILREKKIVGRNDLIKLTGLSASAITRLTKQMVDDKLIEEVENDQGNLGSGRRPILLSLSKSSNYIVSLDIGACEIKAILANLAGEKIGKAIALTPREDASALSDILLRLIDDLLVQTAVQTSQLKGIIFTSVARIDNARGIIENCNIPALGTISLRDLVHRKIPGIDVVVASATCSWSLAEWLKATFENDEKDFILVHCGYSTAMLPLFNGKPPMGFSPVAKIDFGHITHDCLGPACGCGLNGCIESYVGGWAIERDAKASPSPVLLELVGQDVNRITAKAVFDAAEKGDALCIRILERAGRILGRSLSMFIQFYEPKKVIFAGGLVSNEKGIFYRSILDEFSKSMLPGRFKNYTFSVTSLDKFAGAVSATHILINQLLQEPLEPLMEIIW